MTAQDQALSHHPAPHRERVPTVHVLIGLLGGPFAWFAQLCLIYPLASAPCFPHGARATTLAAAMSWTTGAMIAISILAAVIALGALALSRRAFEQTRGEAGGDHRKLIEVGVGRTGFLSLWGMLLSGGSLITILCTALAYGFLPRCVA